MKKILIYGSKYGSAKQYADYLSQKTGITSINYKQAKELSDYDTVVYFGALYAGGILGLEKTVKLLSKNTSLIIATVGLADPSDKANAKHIKASVQKQIPSDIYTHTKIFHLRGRIDYSKLTFTHKLMMKLLYYQVKKLPSEKQTVDTQAMIETYNQTVDFVDFKWIEPLADMLK